MTTVLFQIHEWTTESWYLDALAGYRAKITRSEIQVLDPQIMAAQF